jgi:Carbohydrate family 9 binding domain-like
MALALLALGCASRSPYLAPAPAGEPPNSAVAVYSETPILIDGLANDAVWDESQAFKLVHAVRGSQAKYTTTVQIAWDQKALYLFFHCTDPDIWGNMLKHDDYLWEEEVVEAFIDPDNDRKQYYEFEYSPLGIAFDAHIEAFPTKENIPQFLKYNAKGMQTAVCVNGTLNKRDDKDKYWNCEVAIPWKAFKESGGRMPVAGSGWGMNFFRCDLSGKRGEYQAWGTVRGSFHQSDRFGQVIFRK